MYYLYRNLNIEKFTKKANQVYVATIIIAAILFPFILMDAFGNANYQPAISLLSTVNTTIFLTMCWVKKWLKKID